jgi:rhamnulokinase
MGGKLSERNPRFCAVDLGAGSGRVVAGSLASGRWILDEVARFATPTVHDADSGYQCWNLEQILSHVRSALQRAAHGPVASVGVDSWGVDYVLLDEELRQVGKAVCYRDGRTNGRMERFFDRVPAEEIYRRTGIQFLCFNTLYQLAAACEQESAWMDAARHLLMIPDYIHFRLAGVLSNEYTNATTTQACGLDGQWDQTLLAAAGLKRNLMLEPVSAATVLGEMQLASGCAKVVVPATHDTGSAVAGTPLEGPDEAYISSGTWSLMGIESRTPFVASQAMRMNFTNEGGMERRFRVLKNVMGLWLMQRIAQEHQIADIAALVDRAAGAPAWRTLVNPDDAVFLNPVSMTEALRDYCRQGGEPEPRTPVELARTVFDSLALAYWNVKRQLEELSGRRLERIRIVGGGCQNRLLNQLCADACQIPVVAGPVEASTIGNLSAQAIALGAVRDLDAARAMIRSCFEMDVFRPRTAVPEGAYQRFERLLQARFQKGVQPA